MVDSVVSYFFLLKTCFCFLVVSRILCVLFIFYKFSSYLWPFIITKPCGTCSHGSASCIHDRILHRPTECSLNIVYSPRILESLPHFPRQYLAAIGCTKNSQPIGVTVHSHCVESFGGLSQRCRRGRGCGEL